MAQADRELAALAASIAAQAAAAAAGQAATLEAVRALEHRCAATDDRVAGAAGQLDGVARDLAFLRAAAERTDVALRQQAAQLALLTDAVCDAIRPAR